MADLVFRIIQMEDKDLTALLQLAQQGNRRNPDSKYIPGEVWEQIREDLEAAQQTEIKWCDWYMPKEDLPKSSIPLIKWNPQCDWQMGLPIPASLVSVLAMEPLAHMMDPETRAKIEALNYNATPEETYQTLVKVFEPSFGRFPEKVRDIISRLTTEDMEEIIQFQVC